MKDIQNKEVVLSVKNLKQHFITGSGKYRIYNKAVDGVTFDIHRGEVFSLVGESGCGKTTTGRTIMRLYQPTDGTVDLLGERIVAGYMSLKSDIKLLRKEISLKRKSFKQQEITKDDLDSFVEKSKQEIKLIKDELKQRKLDQFNKYYPTTEEVQTEKEKNSKRIEDLNKAIEGLREELETYKEEVSKDLDKLSPEIEEQQKEKAQALVIKKIQKKQNEIEEKIINLENEISKLSITNDATSKSLLKKIQMIFQDPIDSLDPRMTVKEIIAEGLYINGIKDKKVVTEKVYHALKLVGLMPEHASHYPHEFSGGQRQRVGIARAIACDPEVIIADEPISALDVSIQAQVINLLTDLKEKLGLTILFIAHDLSVVKHFSDTVAVMYFGKIVEMGDKEKVFDNPLHPYTKSLISSIPQPNPDYERLREGVSRYNPQSHNYTKDSVVELREVEPGHQVLCSQEEFEAYKRIVLENE